MTRRALWVVSAAVVLLGSSVQAQIIAIHADLIGANETPPNASPAVGACDGTLDKATGDIAVSCAYQDLLGPRTASHIHRAPAGVAGPVIIPLSGAGPASGAIGPVLGVLSAADVDLAKIQGLYINIHSTVFPGGEIRGQITPEPATLALLGVGVAALLRRRR